MPHSIQTSCIDTLSVVSFYNKSIDQRSAWVCASNDSLQKNVARLRAMKHISDVEIFEATVKR